MARSLRQVSSPTGDGLPARLLEFCAELRREGVQVGTTEVLDGFAALSEIGWSEQGDFKRALASCIAKDRDQRQIFDSVFERFFFLQAEKSALEIGAGEKQLTGSERLALSDLNKAIIRAIEAGDESAMRDLARLAIAAYGREGESSGVVGMDVQRIRRTLGLKPSSASSEDQPAELSNESVRHFESHLRRELERLQIGQTGKLPKAKPLNQLGRALPSSPTNDLASVHRVVAQMKRTLSTVGHESRGRKKASQVDIRHTMRASLQTGGVPLTLKFRPRRPRRPEIYILCDVSTSVSSASVFFLSVLHALHDAFRKLRSFVFVERVAEVTEIFERERDFRLISQQISREGGVADLSGYTDYGRVWREFFEKTADDLDPRSTVIVLGDARTNGREPEANLFGQIAEQAGRTFWLNPEPRLYWNYGDSVMAAYEPHCNGAFECWTTKQLEEFVRVIARTK